jgi:tyrosinase
MYLFHFEQIVRAAVVDAGGPADWALPYWNYGRGGRQATLPRPFRHARTAAGRPNALHVRQRAPGINGGAALSPLVTTAGVALSRPRFRGQAQFGGGRTPARGQFFGQTGALEQTPHNDVHVAVGGQGWMGDPDRAAADPIFWLHHSNIDRLWAVWIGRSGHANPVDPHWTDQEFRFFNAAGHEVTHRCADVLDTVADLHYTYDPAPAAAHALAPAAAGFAAGGGMSDDEEEPEPRLVGATDRPVVLTGAAERVTVPIDAPAEEAALAATPAPRILLNLEDIEAEANPGTVYGVFVDLPEGAPEDVAALHHVGNLSLFGIERAQHPRGDEPPHGFRVSFDITDLAGSLTRQGRWDPEQVELTLEPLGLLAPEGAEEGDEETEPAPPPAGPDDEEAEDRGPVPPVTVGRVSVYYE